jgi:hypothetical protein
MPTRMFLVFFPIYKGNNSNASTSFKLEYLDTVYKAEGEWRGLRTNYGILVPLHLNLQQSM